jgi:rhodanese-related sulfurtransferase
VHLLVTAGGWSAAAHEWIAPRHPAYLVPVRALSVIFRAKMCAALAHAGLLAQTPRALWKTDWVVHCQSAGRGDKVLEYLARYVFRIAISNSRLERIDNAEVTFRYRDGHTQRVRRVRLPALQFLARFLQHVLPRGLAKVRYYGLFSSSARSALAQACASLEKLTPASASPGIGPPIACAVGSAAQAAPAQRCPHCHRGRLLILEVLRAQPRAPP